MRSKLTFSDVAAMKIFKAMLDELEKAGKLPEGPVRWVGEKGFYECVAHLSGKKGITNPKALCGAMKGKAREKGQLKPKHMGRIEKKEYLAKKADFEADLEKAEGEKPATIQSLRDAYFPYALGVNPGKRGMTGKIKRKRSRSPMDIAAEATGLKKVRGSVSGRTYYE